MKKTVSVFVSVLLLAALLQSWAMKESHPATGGRSELNVATFNLRMDTEKDGVNAWPNRKEMVKGLIRFPRFRYLRDTGRVQAHVGRDCRVGWVCLYRCRAR